MTQVADLTAQAVDLIAAQLGDARRPAITSSFQSECVVLTDLLRRVRPDIPVLFLDTFHHFPQTLAYRDEMTARYGLNLINLRAAEPKVGLWQAESTDACCARHKVGLLPSLEAYDVGSRRCAAISRRAARISRKSKSNRC
jgi:3'-phosphoadenosine 5'-phosphosulfate sulfotransferase (PAPS reductase)/FAD synthetase